MTCAAEEKVRMIEKRKKTGRLRNLNDLFIINFNINDKYYLISLIHLTTKNTKVSTKSTKLMNYAG